MALWIASNKQLASQKTWIFKEQPIT